MLVLTRAQMDAMLEHARQEHPVESCGIIAGRCGSDTPETVIPMTNMANSETYFRFDSRQQLQVWRQMDEDDCEPIVLYHSHSGSRAYPSRDDLAFALSPQTHHVIVSTSPESFLEVRSYRYLEGRAVEETIKVIQ